MSKLFETIKNKSIESIIEKILSILWPLLVALILLLLNFVLSISQYVSKEFLLTSNLVLLTLLLLSISFIIRFRKKLKIELKYALGAYWDRELNFYCPSCKKPLTNYGDYEFNKIFSPAYECINCQKLIRLYDGENKYLGIEEAKKIVTAKNLFNK